LHEDGLLPRPESASLTGKRYKLKERTLAIEVFYSSRMPVIVPAGTIINVVSGPGASVPIVDGPTVAVFWADRKLEMLTCDLRMRGMVVADSSDS